MPFAADWFGIGVAGGVATAFTPRPSRWEFQPAALEGRRDLSGVYQGYDALRVDWLYLTHAQYQALMTLWQAARAAGGTRSVKYYDEVTDAVTTVKALMYRPVATARGADSAGPVRYEVSVTFLLSIP